MAKRSEEFGTRIEVVFGQHRSLQLAKRALAQLIRRSGADNGYISARRNARGQYSQRGHHFEFTLEFIEEEEDEEAEYGGAFDSPKGRSK